MMFDIFKFYFSSNSYLQQTQGKKLGFVKHVPFIFIIIFFELLLPRILYGTGAINQKSYSYSEITMCLIVIVHVVSFMFFKAIAKENLLETGYRYLGLYGANFFKLYLLRLFFVLIIPLAFVLMNIQKDVNYIQSWYSSLPEEIISVITSYIFFNILIINKIREFTLTRDV